MLKFFTKGNSISLFDACVCDAFRKFFFWAFLRAASIFFPVFVGVCDVFLKFFFGALPLAVRLALLGAFPSTRLGLSSLELSL